MSCSQLHFIKRIIDFSLIYILFRQLLTAIVNIGGFGNMYTEYMRAIPNDTYVLGNTSCGVPREADWHIFQPASDPQYPWPGVGFGIILLSSYFWCTNQVKALKII